MMKTKRWTAVLLALALILSLSAAAMACGHARGGCWGERSHICADADRDGWCDGCGRACAHGGGHHRGHHGYC